MPPTYENRQKNLNHYPKKVDEILCFRIFVAKNYKRE